MSTAATTTTVCPEFHDNESYLAWEARHAQERLHAFRRARDLGEPGALLALVARQRAERAVARELRRALVARGVLVVAEVFVDRFCLSALEEELFFLVLAARLSANTRRLMLGVQGLARTGGLELGFLIELVFSGRSLLTEPAWLEHGRRLVDLGLLRLEPTPGSRAGDALAQCIHVPHAVAAAMLGAVEVDEALRHAATLAAPRRELHTLVWTPRTATRVDAVARRIANANATARRTHPWRLLLVGDAGTGKSALAEALACRAGDTLFTLRCDRLAQTPELLELAAQNAAFVGAVWHLVCPEALVHARPETVAVLERWLARYPGPILLETRSESAVAELAAHVDEVIELERPDLDVREQLWECLVPAGVEVRGEVRLRDLANDYDLSGGEVEAAIAWALQRASAQGRDHWLTHDDLERGARTRLRTSTGTLTTGSEIGFGLERLVLPPAPMLQVSALLAACRNRLRLLNEWGFGRQLVTGKGLVALFLGEAGTGKTLTAELLAHELGLRLEIVNISEVTSKWLGETEKRIREIFRQARAQRSMLLFDEADALFGTRVQVERAQDQYQNMSVNHLLREIERFDGIVILTTNLETNIDPAFARRILFRIEFPMPDVAERERLWQALIPAQAPRDEVLDLEALAESFELSGGQVKNAIVRAAYQCLEHGTGLTFDALYEAATHESHAAGRLIRDALVDERWC